MQQVGAVIRRGRGEQLSRIAAFAATALVLAGQGAIAAEPYIGRWATSAKDCKSEVTFVFSPKSIAAATFACDGATYQRDGAGWKGVGRQCTSEDPDDAPSDMGFRLTLVKDRLQVFWDDGTKSEPLVRCGR